MAHFALHLFFMDSPNHPLDLLLNPGNRRAFASHGRHWQSNRYVYPVVSRRSGGISIGVNLNPDKVCNFDCVYCCVDRNIAGGPPEVDLAILHSELVAMLKMVQSGDIYNFDPFSGVAPALRRINDIAFSGDGEPTTCRQFFPACQLVAEILQTFQLPEVKIVIITNATMLHRPAIENALSFLDQHNGEIWLKLDAGTEAYYRQVDRSTIPFQRILDNITACAVQRPVVIQTLLMAVHGAVPAPSEIADYVQRISEVVAAGGHIKLIQIYSIARRTTEAYATALSPETLGKLGEQIAAALPNIAVSIFP